jgi:hypothetical protein
MNIEDINNYRLKELEKKAYGTIEHGIYDKECYIFIKTRDLSCTYPVELEMFRLARYLSRYDR